VNDFNFSNNRIFLGYRGGTSLEAKAILNKYPEGSTVTIYYQKDDPANAVLQPGFKTAVLHFPLMGLFFLILSVLGHVFLTTPENILWPEI
jgi:hypothetical protein